jgi:transposase
MKLGVDVHADSYRVVRQIDSSTPQPAQKMTPEKFLVFAARQLTLAQEVHCCYEAGPFGYGLHRKLLKMGIHNVVVRPQNWDELHTGVKTDKTDALALVQRLDRYVQGNTKQ